MSRRIDIELTSARPDGTWTWRAAGAQKPKGVLDGSLLPAGAAVGNVYRADTETELEGITVLGVNAVKGSSDRGNVLEMLGSDRPFEAVTSQLVRRERGERGDRGDRPRRDRPDRPRGDRPGGERPRRDHDRDRERPAGERGERPRRDHDRSGRPDGPDAGGDRRARPERRSRPAFTPPPELPSRPKAKRLKPGRAHRSAVLAELPEAERPVAERALQGGIPAVRQAISEQNAQLKANGQDEVPAAGLIAMAEQLLPRLRVAEWLDRADAAKRDLDELDLRDLRSVVAGADDPMVARDESTRGLAAELKQALSDKQDREQSLWLEDIDAAVGVGRVVRALKLSSQPPKAGVRFPVELGAKLAEATNANLTADALPERWVALLEAAAFSPIRAQVQPPAKAATVNDELLATVRRLAALLPQVAGLYEVEVPTGGQSPKPLRPTRPPQKKPAGTRRDGTEGRPPGA